MVMRYYDNLTMLYNRSGFAYEANTFLNRFKEENKNIFIIFMDADGLKMANDTYGHDMREINQSRKYAFKLSASIGVSTWKANNISSLDVAIEQADQKMYQEKRAKKLAAMARKRSKET